MVTLALLGVVVAIGVPSFKEFSRNGRMVTIANDFLGGIQTARTEAIKRQIATGGVAICPSSNPDAAEPTCLDKDTKNFNGWIVFVDSDNDCVRNKDKPEEVVIRTGERIDLGNSEKSYRKSASTGSCISFAATGFIRAVKDRVEPIPARTVFCDERGLVNQPGTSLSISRGVEVTATGRARITRDGAEIATWGVECK